MGASEAGQLGMAALKGGGDGAIIAADAYTFGLISPLNKAASQKVSEYGAAGKWSRGAAYVSAAAAYSAIGLKSCGQRCLVRKSRDASSSSWYG